MQQQASVHTQLIFRNGGTVLPALVETAPRSTLDEDLGALLVKPHLVALCYW